MKGTYATITSGGLFSSLANKDGSLTFHNPAGRLITIPSHAKDIIFSTYDVFFIRNTNVPTEVNGAIGSLLAFTIGDTQYKASGDNSRNKFAGYFNGSIGYLDTLSYKNNVSNGIVLLTGVESKKFKGFAVKLTPENKLVEKTSYGEAIFSNDLFIVKLQPEDLAKSINRFLADRRAEDKAIIDDIQVLFQNKFSNIEIDKEIFRTEDFLKNSLHEGSSIADILAHFILAYQAPNVISSFSSCLDHNINEAMNSIIIAFKTRHLSTELTSIDYSFGESLSVKFQNTALRSFEELNAANQLRAELLASKNITSVYEAIKKNHSTCTFKALSLSDREMILKWLLPNDNSYWTIHSVDIIEELLNNAPKDQIVPLLKLFMQENYSWLYTIYNNGPSNTYKSNLIYLIVQKVVENYSSLSIPNTLQPVFFEGFSEYSSFEIPTGARPFFIPLKKGTNTSPIKDFELVVGENNESGRIEFTKDGYLRFVQTYSYKDTRLYYQNADLPLPRSKGFEIVDFKITPFETVTLLLMNSYPELGFETNQLLEVPAILSLFILKDIKSQEFQRELRTYGNTLAALIATFTIKRPVNVGIFLTRISGTVAVLDGEIQSHKIKYPSSYHANKELYDAWEQIYISVAFADGIYGLHSLVRAINIASLAKNIENYSALLKNGKNYPDIFTDALSSLKSLSPQGVFKNIAKGAGKLDLGKFVKKIGDYEVFEGGEVFYRTMSKEHYEALLNTKKLSATSETFTSPTQLYSEAYEGYLVKISVKHGTLDKLKLVGTSDGTADVVKKFGEMPKNSKGWTSSNAYFKKEGAQVNIGLGKGNALELFNENINGFELIKIIE